MIGGLVAGLLAAELLLRRVAPVDDPYAEFKVQGSVSNQFVASEFPRNHQVLTRHSRVDGTGTGNDAAHKARRRFTTNNMGFRGATLARPKPATELRVFITGASTAECLYLDDADALHAVLEQTLADQVATDRTVKVYNSAKSHGRSYDHVSMVVHRLLHLDPDLIIVFAGLNDLLASIYGTDYLHFVESAPRRFSAGLIARMWLTEWQLPRRAFSLLRRSEPHGAAEVRTRPVAGSREGTPPTDVTGYQKNVTTIAAAAHAHGVRVLVVTQPTTWNSAVDADARQWQTNLQGYSEMQMDTALEAFNDVVRQLPVGPEIAVFDLAKTLPKSTQYFYDDAHFTVAGARFVGELIGRFVLERGLLPARHHAATN